MFPRHLMHVPQAFDACSSGVWWHFLGVTSRDTYLLPQSSLGVIPVVIMRNFSHVPQAFDGCSPGIWRMFLRRLMKFSWGYIEKYISSSSEQFRSHSCGNNATFQPCSPGIWWMFPRHLMHVPQAFDDIFLRLYRDKHLLPHRSLGVIPLW